MKYSRGFLWKGTPREYFIQIILFLWKGSSNDSGVVDDCNFSTFSVVTSLETVERLQIGVVN